ncbi:hypothetical protein Tco_0873345 [Tanacetum coccineum]
MALKNIWELGEVPDSCDTAQEIWKRVEQMMKGNQIGYNAMQIAGNQNRNQNGLIVVPGIANQNANQNGNGNVVAAWAEGNGNGNNGNHVRCYNCRGMAEEFDLMVVAWDIDEIKEVNANCILMANLQQASTSSTQTDKALVYDLDGLAEVQQNDSNVIYVDSTMEHSGGIVKQYPATVEETRAYFESLYNNLVTEVKKVNTVNRIMKVANADLTTELARYNGQEKSFEINKAKFDELEIGYRKSVYQEQCLTKKINALHLTSAKQITALNEEITNLNNQLLKEKSNVSLLQEEK